MPPRLNVRPRAAEHAPMADSICGLSFTPILYVTIVFEKPIGGCVRTPTLVFDGTIRLRCHCLRSKSRRHLGRRLPTKRV